MRKLLLLLLFIPLVCIGQKINKDSNGYTEVVEVELSKKDIHQKINEWIALNYKSAQDVIQLNKEYKLVIKGNFTFSPAYLQGLTYGVRNTLTFSIRDNKFKIDLTPTSMFDKSTMKDSPLPDLKQYMKEIQDEEEFKIIFRRNVITRVQNTYDYSDKKTIKNIDNQLTSEFLSKLYNEKKQTFANWDKAIESTFKSIKDYVSKSEDDDEEIPITEQLKTPPPAPEIIEIVEDEEEIEETIIESTETDQEEIVEEVEVMEEEMEMDIPFAIIEDVPLFPGCERVAKSKRRDCFQEKMNIHIRKNFRYPEIAQEMGIQGRVFVMFTIGSDGSIINIRTRGPDKNLEKEAKRIITKLPQMTPGRQRGRAVRVPFSIPIQFKLQ